MRHLAIANSIAALAIAIWSWLFFRVSSHYGEIAQAGYAGEWDIWVYLPVVMTVSLVLCCLFFSLFVRSAGALIFIATAALFAVLPYLAMTGGGV